MKTLKVLKALKALKEYLATRQNLTPISPLWLNDDNVRFQFFGLREMLKRCCKKAGMPVNGSLHAFRRAFALTLWRKGVDVLSISRLLGHTSVEITKRYLNINNEDLQKAHSKASPADDLA